MNNKDWMNFVISESGNFYKQKLNGDKIKISIQNIMCSTTFKHMKLQDPGNNRLQKCKHTLQKW